jgi:hypothetical protein
MAISSLQGAKFVRPCDAGNAQANSLCSNDIASMRRRRNHHAFAGRQIERFSSGEIDPRFWLVVASNLGAENGLEAKLERIPLTLKRSLHGGKS